MSDNCTLYIYTCVYIHVLHSHTLRVWELSPETRKIVATDCNLGQLKRIVQCIQVSPDDEYMFCGTSSGDVLQVLVTLWLYNIQCWCALVE